MEGIKGPKNTVEPMLQKDTEPNIDALLEEFPEELQERLETEIEDLGDKDAANYLVDKLTARKEAITTTYSDIEGVTVMKEVPSALSDMIHDSQLSGEFLGAGQNGAVNGSKQSSDVCFKVLFSDRAAALHVNIFKEAGYQHKVQELLADCTDCAKVPEVLSVVNSGELQAIMMRQIDGVSLKELMDDNTEVTLPDDFDIDVCFEKLQKSLDLMHEFGYFHRDLTNNAGNVLIDKQGEPWIIDFGACVKSIDPERSTNSYQLTVGGARFLQKDDYGLTLLKDRLYAFINKQGGQI